MSPVVNARVEKFQTHAWSVMWAATRGKSLTFGVQAFSATNNWFPWVNGAWDNGSLLYMQNIIFLLDSVSILPCTANAIWCLRLHHAGQCHLPRECRDRGSFTSFGSRCFRCHGWKSHWVKRGGDDLRMVSLYMERHVCCGPGVLENWETMTTCHFVAASHATVSFSKAEMLPYWRFKRCRDSKYPRFLFRKLHHLINCPTMRLPIHTC